MKIIDETTKYCLGEVNALILYDYLAKRSCSLDEIPEKLEVFSMELRSIMGFGPRQVYGAASILEETIAQALCLKLKLLYDENGPIVFADYIRKLKRAYCQESKEDVCINVEKVHRDKTSSTDESPRAEHDGGDEALKKGKAKILMVDDDEHICRVMSLILEGEGFEVETAYTGEEAIKKSKRKVYDAAILDVRLPDIVGTKLLKTMRETSPKMVKIMLTGYPNLQNAVDSLNFGADAYLTKPVSNKVLIETLEKLIKNTKLEEKET